MMSPGKHRKKNDSPASDYLMVVLLLIITLALIIAIIQTDIL